MDNDAFSADPCTEAARKMAKARETLANSRLPEERSAAAREYEELMQAVAETQFSARAATSRVRTPIRELISAGIYTAAITRSCEGT